MLNNSTKQLESKDTNTKIEVSTDNSIYLVTDTTVASDLEDFSFSTSSSGVLTFTFLFKRCFIIDQQIAQHFVHYRYPSPAFPSMQLK